MGCNGWSGCTSENDGRMSASKIPGYNGDGAGKLSVREKR